MLGRPTMYDSAKHNQKGQFLCSYTRVLETTERVSDILASKSRC
jgi:hypothetical protein